MNQNIEDLNIAFGVKFGKDKWGRNVLVITDDGNGYITTTYNHDRGSWAVSQETLLDYDAMLEMTPELLHDFMMQYA